MMIENMTNIILTSALSSKHEHYPLHQKYSRDDCLQLSFVCCEYLFSLYDLRRCLSVWFTSCQICLLSPRHHFYHHCTRLMVQNHEFVLYHPAHMFFQSLFLSMYLHLLFAIVDKYVDGTIILIIEQFDSLYLLISHPLMLLHLVYLHLICFVSLSNFFKIIEIFSDLQILLS